MDCLKVCVYRVATPQGSLSYVILSGNQEKSLCPNFCPWKKGALIYGGLRKNYWSQISDLVEDENEGIKCRSEYWMVGGPYFAHSHDLDRQAQGAQTGKGGLCLKKLKPSENKTPQDDF